MISTTFEYDKQKTIQALRYHFISRREIKVMMILVNVFALFSAALFFFKKISPVAFLLSSFLWMLMMILFWFLLPRIVYRKSGLFRERVKLTLDNSDLSLQVNESSRSFPWDSFSDWMETPHFFHLYFNSRAFFLIPKDAFEEKVDEARAWCKNRIKTKN